MVYGLLSSAVDITLDTFKVQPFATLATAEAVLLGTTISD